MITGRNLIDLSSSLDQDSRGIYMALTCRVVKCREPALLTDLLSR